MTTSTKHASSRRIARENPPSPPRGPASSQTPVKHKHRKPSNSTVQVDFYYILVAFVIVFLCLCLWLVHVRRRRRKLALATSAGQNALARDIDGLPYPNNRPWAGGVRRGEGGLFATRDEGLDERGEAPPPYKPAGAGHRRPNEELGDDGEAAAAGIAIPLQTFHRDDPLPKPPEYRSRPEPSSEGQGGSHDVANSSHIVTGALNPPDRTPERPVG